MRGVLCGLGLVIFLFGGADAFCEHFGGSYPNIYIFEDGEFRIHVDPIDASAITGIAIEDSQFGKYFKAAKNEAGDKWVLEVLPGLTVWYDAHEPGFDPDVLLTITYTCSASPNGWDYEHPIIISEQNNRAPAFSQTSYDSTIPKLMPPDVPIHFVDTDLEIIAMDGDFVCPYEDCNVDDTSNNIVAFCIVNGDEDNVIQCESKEEDESGKYRMWVSLTKSIDYMQATSYSFNLHAQDGGTPPLVSEPVTVTLKFEE